MDAKITKLRLSRMLSYDWFKILIATAAVVVVWLFIFTLTGTAIMPSQQFSVHNYLGNQSFSTGEFSDFNTKAFNSDIFSYEVIESGVPLDLPSSPDNAGEMLQARATLEEGDIVFVADSYNLDDITVEEITNGQTGEIDYTYTFGNTYLQQFVSYYRFYLYDINEYLKDMRKFVGQYYDGGDYSTPSELNEQKIKDDFNERTKKDKRFRKAAARAQGEQDEIERIQKYRDALVKFEWYLDNGVVALTETVIPDYFGEGRDFRGTYSINMCPTEDKGGKPIAGEPAMDKLANCVAYKPVITAEENGKTVLSYGDRTADNMNVCLYNFGGVHSGFQYERLSYLVFMIDYYSATPCPPGIYA